MACAAPQTGKSASVRLQHQTHIGTVLNPCDACRGLYTEKWRSNHHRNLEGSSCEIKLRLAPARHRTYGQYLPVAAITCSLTGYAFQLEDRNYCTVGKQSFRSTPLASRLKQKQDSMLLEGSIVVDCNCNSMESSVTVCLEDLLMNSSPSSPGVCMLRQHLLPPLRGAGREGFALGSCQVIPMDPCRYIVSAWDLTGLPY